MKAPFPWFGGKSKVADIVWQRFGNVPNYVEPFYGSGAVHLLRPQAHHSGIWPLETINDYDGYVSNFWRSIKHDSEAVAHHADWPANENDLHGRHIWLVQQRESLRARLEGDHEFYDAKIAGYWVWGICSWIGGHFCSGKGPWHSVDGQLVNVKADGRGINRQRVHLGNKGQGINRKRVHLGDKGQGINRKLVHLGDKGRGINRKLVHLGNKGRGINRKLAHLGNKGRGEGGIYEWFTALSDRLRRVRVASGDWSRVCGPTPTFQNGLTGVFLDPPYGEEANREDLYRIDSHTIAHDVRQWCIENGDNPLLRIALCGYDGEHNKLQGLGWSVYSWSAHGGYSNERKNGTNDNRHKELIWFSPHCVRVDVPKQMELL
jgi:hypothetical protein